LMINYEDQFLGVADLLTEWLEIPVTDKKSRPHDYFSSDRTAIPNGHNNNEMKINLIQKENADKGLQIEVRHMGKIFEKSINYGGHPSNYYQWAGNHILILLREIIQNIKE
jgi:hypothetical protein